MPAPISFEQRQKIEEGLKKGWNISSVAIFAGCCHPTVAREVNKVKRHGHEAYTAELGAKYAYNKKDQVGMKIMNERITNIDIKVEQLNVLVNSLYELVKELKNA